MEARVLRQVSLTVALVAGLALPRAARADDKLAACIKGSERAQELEKKGQLLEARKEARSCSSGCPDELARDCVEVATRTERDLATVVFAAQRDGVDVAAVEVLVDGVRVSPVIDGKVVELDPGAHVVLWRFDDGETVEQKVVANQGERNRRVVGELKSAAKSAAPSAPAGAASSAPPALFWVFAATSVASFGTAGAMGGLALAERGDLDACIETKTCDPDAVSAVKTKALVADVMFGVGGATALGAILSWALWPTPEAESPRAAAFVVPSAHGLMFGVAGQL